MQNLLSKALHIAETEDVTTALNGAVVYSVSYMPTENNKELAKTYLATNPNAKMLDDTPCGKALIALGLEGKVNEVGEDITAIWKLASKRFINEASGNINAFVENADERSTFCTTELSEILANPKITHINSIDKQEFAQNFKPLRY